MKSIVIGTQTSALALIDALVEKGDEVVWVTGTGTYLYPLLPVLDASQELSFADKMGSWGIAQGERGSFLRESRGKGFQPPAWNQAPSPETRQDVKSELLWEPEALQVPSFEFRPERDLSEVVEEVRERLLKTPGLSIIEGRPVAALEKNRVTLSNGEAIEADRVLYADRWADLATLDSVDAEFKTWIRSMDPVSTVQVIFDHQVPVGEAVLEGFSLIPHKDAKEKITRRIWGYFTNGGKKSVWSILIHSEEVEDNQLIAKKVRRIRQTLDRVFVGGEWVPEGFESFTETIAEERVRFEEAVLHSRKSTLKKKKGPEVPPELPYESKGILYFNDGWGPSSALDQVNRFLSAAAAPDKIHEHTEHLQL